MSERSLAGLDACVHCGFCLQSCPTYLSTGDESDSPRGRIVMIKGLLQGRTSPSERLLAVHLDRCLGCLSCESACPSGVRYGPALEQSRAMLGQSRPIPLAARLINAVMADRRLWRPMLGVARLIRPVARAFTGKSRIGMAFGMLAATNRLHRGRQGSNVQPRQVTAQASAATHTCSLFTGCIMDGLFGHVHRATERVLVANGYALAPVHDQTCCGALHAHTGQIEKARRLARSNVRAFSVTPDSTIVVNSAGCGAILKEYGELLVEDPLEAEARRFSERVRDVTEVLAKAGPLAGASIRLRVAYDAPCHLLHAQRVVDAPRKVLEAIPGLELVAHADSDHCCGSAGSYSLTQSTLSGSVLDRKIGALSGAAPDMVTSGNPGCVMQIGAGLICAGSGVQVVHPVELLDLSYERAGFYVG